MGTRWETSLTVACDRCGEFCTFEGASKPTLLKQARAAGWYIEAETLCTECREVGKDER